VAAVVGLVTELLYQKDSYLREFYAYVIEVSGNAAVLDRTAFHPTSGGVDKDIGFLYRDGDVYRVVDVVLEEGGVVKHVVGDVSGLYPGALVRGVIDWDRRYRLMRLHTTSHILLAVMYRRCGALVSGGHVYPDHAGDDFDLEFFDRRIFEEAFEEVNEIVRRGLEVRVYWLPRDEALKIPGADVQADGGPHVRKTSEVGRVVMLSAESRGRRRKRVYYTVKP